MNKFQITSMFFFFMGIALIFMAFISGEVKGGFFVVFPFLIGSGAYTLFGILLIFLAFFLFMLGIWESFGEKMEMFEEMDVERPVEKKVEGGGLSLIHI